LDDNFRGITPMRIDGILPGSHTLKLEARGYRDWVLTLYLREGEVRPVQARLKPLDHKLTSN
ncbi:PEGA domain-containing protein, partial [bacterium]|nr:PEGA domain-containing protein [bacterium]